MINIENAIKIVQKTGKLEIGTQKAINLIKNGRGQIIIVANNCPQSILEDLKIYAQFSNIPIYTYKGSNWDLGFLCGKMFMISVLTILDPGDSDILKLREKESD
jgi:large subunit ribosomal protein L30e